MTIDIAGLIDDGHLTLDNICTEMSWQTQDCIAEYTQVIENDPEIFWRDCEVWIQKAQEYGIEVYRWVAVWHRGLPPASSTRKQACGDPTISRDEAVADGKQFAADSDDDVDKDMDSEEDCPNTKET